ncbi:UNVERIFIED_CONTAM: hypothetical protein Sradi_1834100 [Sesamum radiatum]|uniref:Secreted protein n=1 Tax=Sesamum radiatum TaxID=300843 RepID=A0AAW2TXJ0_SESRA
MEVRVLLYTLFANVARWKSVPLSALSSQMSLGGSLCLSALSSQICAVPQDSVSNTPELIWNGGSMESVFLLKTVPQIHPN